MAGRGPSPEPTALRKLKGNPSGRPLPADEPAVATAVPEMPRGMSPAARREWRRVTPLLDEAGLIAKLDAGVLAGYCEAWSIFIEADDEHLDRKLKAGAELRRYGQEFGLSPSARTRIRMTDAAAKKAELPADEEFLMSAPPLRVVK